MYNYIQVKHTTSGDVLGQTLTFETYDAMLLEYHQQMKNAINNADVLGVDVKVFDMQLNIILADKWIRGQFDAPTE